MITFAEACTDPNLFGPWFEADSWAAWRVVDKALFGEPLDADELATFTELTGRTEAPTEPAEEAWFVCGRRSGKDVKAAALGAFLATFGAEQLGFLSRLVRGERGVVQILAVDRDQARVCLGYLRAYFEQPILAQMVAKSMADGLELTNGLGIEITTNDQRRVRGRTVVAVVFDEVAFWRSEATVNPDLDVYRAVKPAMATIPGAMLIGISSPYARRGLLWTKYRKHYGKPGKVLIVQAPTWRMNPTIKRDGDFLTEAFNDDPASAAAEFGAQFRVDVEAFVTREVVEACLSPGVYERAPVNNTRYVAFVDPSGGSQDSMTLAIAHEEGGDDRVAVLDAVRERKPPFSPEAVVGEFCDLLKQYGIRKVTGDRYGGEWPREQFRKHGIEYDCSEAVRSDLYRDLLPALNSQRCDLLDHDKLANQIVGLERRVARGGRESIDHAPGGHDDLANSVAGAVWLILQAKKTVGPWIATRRSNRPAQERFYIQ
ncbi:hypothetical protein [Croceicoccus naphthovorans]|uniref:Uncharacterized protein n=1 Tax=Croceicoccus naphthovorans TaxID=1348774 RepID=A0A0G3XCN4_9SPHN|nr:hypothetical protein [Croceicoccus naphthovorans]AKM09315.1 hypothetical protein AB433_03890 [Croceicoccus naphthovorans]MBB3990221.1 hypothetical protein [Croceicoccus naphthovorans]